PQGGLTCLFAKATPDESNLWHKRLGHWKWISKENDKNRSQINKTERENGKSVKKNQVKAKSQQKVKVKSSQGQPQEVELERA
ncbi:hypothetical protein Tco_0402965, partial [Tanacetum coccineum]